MDFFIEINIIEIYYFREYRNKHVIVDALGFGGLFTYLILLM